MPRWPGFTLTDKFWAKVKKGSSCWNWIGSADTRGYGRIGNEGKRPVNMLAHRLSWEIHFGPIPPGMFVCHKCDNPSCVNPEHLFTGSRQDNIDDMVRKGRSVTGEQHYSRKHPEKVKRGEIHPAAKLSECDVQSIKELLKLRAKSNQQIANVFGVSRTLIRKIRDGQTWTHV